VVVVHCLLYVLRVIVTGAFLAESAAVVDSKLDVRGGVLSSYQVGPDRLAKVALVVLTQAQAFDKDVRVNIEVVKPSGEIQTVQAAIPKVTLEAENGFAFFPIGIVAETDGRYVLVVTCGGSSVSLTLKVRS
jgi:hypothetical protein